MVCLGFEPGTAEWKAQTNPLSYGGTPNLFDAKNKPTLCSLHMFPTST